eukprot:CAMPEP_0198527170 /NCGR_PEP_ID=MMETSP1462-20131121/24396_1 /TAXON_ID=1333877 /ORGANISM="Brandtodinium nutriculum, Strain RCC3387" /LENGTH=64 /DNA_ID=CAMNT_0044256963 /DNA_START=65 /DNA_END=256 /DNA_ORIENTATION=+
METSAEVYNKHPPDAPDKSRNCRHRAGQGAPSHTRPLRATTSVRGASALACAEDIGANGRMMIY